MSIIRHRRRHAGIDYWPGFVDALSTLVLAIDGANIVPQTAKKIADALGMKPEELFDFE